MKDATILRVPLPDGMTKKEIKRLKKIIKQDLIAALTEFAESEAERDEMPLLDKIPNAIREYNEKHTFPASRLYLDTSSHRALCEELSLRFRGAGFFSLYGDTLFGVRIYHTEEAGWWVR